MPGAQSAQGAPKDEKEPAAQALHAPVAAPAGCSKPFGHGDAVAVAEGEEVEDEVGEEEAEKDAAAEADEEAVADC